MVLEAEKKKISAPSKDVKPGTEKGADRSSTRKEGS
jgi:hypothetical protein